MFISVMKRRVKFWVGISMLLVLAACGTASPAAPIEVTVIKEVVTEVEQQVEVVKNAPVPIGDHSTAPSSPPYDHDTHFGEPKLQRSAAAIHTHYTALSATPTYVCMFC